MISKVKFFCKLDRIYFPYEWNSLKNNKKIQNAFKCIISLNDAEDVR